MSNTYQKNRRRAQPDPLAGEVAVPEQVIVSMAEIAGAAREGLRVDLPREPGVVLVLCWPHRCWSAIAGPARPGAQPVRIPYDYSGPDGTIAAPQ